MKLKQMKFPTKSNLFLLNSEKRPSSKLDSTKSGTEGEWSWDLNASSTFDAKISL